MRRRLGSRRVVSEEPPRRGRIRSLAREQRVAEERVIEDLLRQQLDLPQADIVIEERKELGE